MIGPRNSVVRILRGEDVPLEELLTDHSEFICTETEGRLGLHELWVDQIHDFVYEEVA